MLRTSQQNAPLQSECVLSPNRGGDARAPTQFHSSGRDKQIAVESDVKHMATAGHTVWMAHGNGTISVRKSRTAEVVATMKPFQGFPWCLQLVEVGAAQYMWVGLSNGDIEVYDAASFTPESLLSRHTGGIYCLAEFSGSVFSGSNDFEIMQWDAAKRVFVRQLSGHTNYVRALVADGPFLFSASNDKTVRVWNTAAGKLVATGKYHEEGVGCLCRVGDTLWSGDEAGKIVVSSIDTLSSLAVLSEHYGRVNCIKKAGSRVYSGGSDFEIIVWDAAQRTMISKVADHKGWLHHFACPARLTRYFLWSAASDSTVRCWHHDEYCAMTPDVERFDDMSWFQAQHNPFKELNQALATELRDAQQYLHRLQERYNEDVSLLQGEAEKGQVARRMVMELEGTVGSTNDLNAEKDRKIESLQSAIAAKDEELTHTNAKAIRLTKEQSELRTQVDELKAKLEEQQRRNQLLQAERDSAEIAVEKLRQLRPTTAGGAVPEGEGTLIAPLVITNDTQAQNLAAKLHKELEECMKLNESFRTEIMRYKTMMGIDPNPTPKATSHLRPGTAAQQAVASAAAATPAISGGCKERVAGSVAVGDGYSWRGAHFSDGNLRTLVNDRYYNERVLFHTGAGSRVGSARGPSAIAKSPRAPQSTSCRCPGQQPRRLRL